MMNRRMQWLAAALLAFPALGAMEGQAAELELHPLAQSQVMTVAAGIQSLSFDALGGGELRIAVVSGAELGLALRLPDGTRITPDNAGQHGAEFRRVTPEAELEALEFPQGASTVTLAASTAGRYILELESQAALGGVLVRIDGANGDIRAALSIADQRLSVSAGQRTPVVLALSAGDGPLTGASVSGAIRDSRGIQLADLAFNDGGTAPDPRANDGFYTGYLETDATGSHFLTVVVSGEDRNGHAYSGREAARVLVTPPDIQLTRAFQDQGVDSDGDGYLDHVAIDFEASGTRAAGQYDLTVYLRAGNGKQVDATSRVADPAQPLRVSVPAETLKRLGADGPWTVASVVLWHDASPLGRWDELGQTQAYRLDQLERHNTLIKGMLEESASDTDGDGRFDQLNISFQVDTLLPGVYGVSADLRAQDGRVIDEAGHTSVQLSQGLNSIPLRFSGQKIGESGQDGPYVLGNVLVYPRFNADASSLADTVGLTRAYACEDFLACESNPLSLLVELMDYTQALDLAAGLKSSLLAKLSAAKAELERQGPDADKAAANQLLAFQYQVRTQRERGIPAAEADYLVGAAGRVIALLRA